MVSIFPSHNHNSLLEAFHTCEVTDNFPDLTTSGSKDEKGNGTKKIFQQYKII